ncbi:MAG: YafY family transcriptional regulator [Alcaligenes faecalis]|jgi:predicted DNA-binding transcriptional regulator YafY|uniref:helix-turn-helix transcriptional regulator n=1 Tax=Alcaligenes aquatilis TaxID=323284 RepID=UPI000F67FB68|nr:YafY family protein [Alcaligenes aquatilis]MCH4225027.1 YafY family transcriptional regulator [Alcaligenes faecalis]QXR36633.1 YafY family transcriptional regulator [Alcaligenes aquatilis]
MKTLRLFALLDQLRSARYPVSAEALAQRFGVSPRTIYRDMASLQAMGAPVRGESGLGYQLEKGYFLPPLQFDPDEMEAIMLGLRLVIARDCGDLRDAAQRVSGKVASALGEEGGERFQTLPILAVSRPQLGEEQVTRWGSILRKSIRERRVLELAYCDLGDRTSCRRVHPLGLTLFDEAWLLTAWCELRQDFRNFRLDRISGIKEMDDHFRPQNGQRFKDYLAKL